MTDHEAIWLVPLTKVFSMYLFSFLHWKNLEVGHPMFAEKNNNKKRTPPKKKNKTENKQTNQNKKKQKQKKTQNK